VATEWNTSEVVDLLLCCGRIAAEAQEQATWTLKQDGSLVTAVDREVEHTLAERLDRPEAGSFLIGEETVGSRDEAYIQAALANTAWIVDPVDGTAPFAHGFGHWGVSIGFARAGVIEQGAVFLPASGELFITQGDGVCLATGVGARSAVEQVRLVALEPRPLPLSDGGMVALGQRFVKSRRFPWPNPVIVTGCAVNALSYLMLGRLMGCLGFMCVWDLAGVLPMLERTGFVARLADGTPLTSRLGAGAFVLEPGRPDRWAQRDHAAFGSPDVVDALVTDVLARSDSPSATASAGQHSLARRAPRP
jgi:fructose-1,6-bisphosphatase/inositol monophosphatase family enzyme